MAKKQVNYPTNDELERLLQDAEDVGIAIVTVLENYKMGLSNMLHRKPYRERSDESIIYAKRDFLLSLLHLFPIRGNSCIYCLRHEYDCDNCEWAKVYNKCDSVRTNWKQMHSAKKVLEAYILKTYTPLTK